MFRHIWSRSKDKNWLVAGLIWSLKFLWVTLCRLGITWAKFSDTTFSGGSCMDHNVELDTAMLLELPKIAVSSCGALTPTGLQRSVPWNFLELGSYLYKIALARWMVAVWHRWIYNNRHVGKLWQADYIWDCFDWDKSGLCGRSEDWSVARGLMVDAMFIVVLWTHPYKIDINIE